MVAHKNIHYFYLKIEFNLFLNRFLDDNNSSDFVLLTMKISSLLNKKFIFLDVDDKNKHFQLSYSSLNYNLMILNEDFFKFYFK